MLYNNTKPNVIYSLLVNYLHEQITKGYNINGNEIHLLFFLLEDIWNIKFSSVDYDKKYLGLNYLQKLKKCLYKIKMGKNYIFSSIILLRRLLPLILKYFEFYFECYYKNNQEFDIEKINISIYRYKEEKIFDSIRKIELLNKKKKAKNCRMKLQNLIISYFMSLNTTMKRFSEFWKHYCPYDEEAQSNFWKEEGEGKGDGKGDGK